MTLDRQGTPLHHIALAPLYSMGSLPRHEEAKDHRLEHLLGRRVDGGSREETVLPVALDS